MARKIKSGILGLNPLLDGGINENSVTVVVGSSGAGKTIFATQFLHWGLQTGQEGIYITLDEPPEQLLNEAEEMGWGDLRDYMKEERMVFIDATGKQFTEFIKRELADFVREWRGSGARIVVDPLTPVLWSSQTRYEQRDLVSFMMREVKKMGTVLCTLEEHGTAGDLSTPETIIPLYISDAVIHLRYVAREGEASRMLKIVKCRSSRHSHRSHPYRIIKGAGLVVEPDGPPPARPSERVTAESAREYFRKKIAALPREKFEMVPERTWRALDRMIECAAQESAEGVELSRVVSLLLQELGQE
ncbi:MAG: ATPase domain-containing protein [Thermoplasmata archaeon]